ncbi:hypothetical protein ACFWZT_09010 [Streptomyces alboflavus]|uniref:hypothetical protein n=1 Tax=Streptomyces alboflavus TaxID=67267 RepID=UPI00368FC61B
MSHLQQSHLTSLLDMVGQLTEQAQAGLENDTEAARVFLAVYSGFLIETGTGIRWILEPDLIEHATEVIARRAPDAGPASADLAARLLATLWASCVLAGVDTEDWAREAPELPAICIRMAGFLTGEREAGPEKRTTGPEKRTKGMRDG